jgi:hypothetical protein
VPILRPVLPGSGPGSDPRAVCGRSAVEKVALERVVLRALRLSPVSVVPPMLHTHSSACHRRCIVLATDNVVK